MIWVAYNIVSFVGLPGNALQILNSPVFVLLSTYLIDSSVYFTMVSGDVSDCVTCGVESIIWILSSDSVEDSEVSFSTLPVRGVSIASSVWSSSLMYSSGADLVSSLALRLASGGAESSAGGNFELLYPAPFSTVLTAPVSPVRKLFYLSWQHSYNHS